MYIRYIAFKWHIDANLESVVPILEKLELHCVKKNIWSRSISNHILHVEYRDRLSSQERSYFWLQWSSNVEDTQPSDLERILGDCFFSIRMHFTLCVNWMQVALDLSMKAQQPLYGYQERTPRIWSKTDKEHKFTFYPVKDHYYFEVRNGDIRESIQHHRYIQWLDELKYSLQGQEKPDDQLRLFG